MGPQHKFSNCTAKQTRYLVSYTRPLHVVGKSFKARLSSAPVAPRFVLYMFVLEEISNHRPEISRPSAIEHHRPETFSGSVSFDVPVVTPLKSCSSTVTVHLGATLSTISAFDAAQIVSLFA